ncbi:MAG: hypothetical protein IJZ56_04130 [Oscillospiraceae bacterium]|nr:hypothetical protein [Oscillospiraceae bacterium]
MLISTPPVCTDRGYLYKRNDARQIIFPHPTVSEIIREVLWEFDDK